MYRKAMSTHLVAGDDRHDGRCDDGKESLCSSGRKPCGRERSLGLRTIICENSLTVVGVIACFQQLTPGLARFSKAQNFRGSELRRGGDGISLLWHTLYRTGNGPNDWSREQFNFDWVRNG